MRFVFVDLQFNDLIVRTWGRIINQKIAITKHRFLLDYLLQSGYDVCNYISKTQTYMTLKKYSTSSIEFEKSVVYKANGLTGKIIDIYDSADIKEDDIVILYSFYNSKVDLRKLRGRKFINVNHFFKLRGLMDDRCLSEILADVEIEGYIAESNVIRYSKFFQEYFPIIGKRMVLMPYAYEARFQNRVPFSERKNLAMASGALGLYIDLLEPIYGTKCLHPMREQIYQKHNLYPNEIDSYISFMRETHNLFNVTGREPKIIWFIKKLINRIYRDKNSKFSKKNKKNMYYSMDIVEIFNQYRMFVWPEEVTGLPAQGFVEGMACGCAYIGVKNGIYEDLGLVDGETYIGYDGTFEDLIRVIRFYQSNEDKLGNIALNGYNFVKKEFSQHIIAQRLVEQLRNS